MNAPISKFRTFLTALAAALPALSLLSAPEQWGDLGPGFSAIGTTGYEDNHLVFVATIHNYGTADGDTMVSETVTTQNGSVLALSDVYVDGDPMPYTMIQAGTGFSFDRIVTPRTVYTLAIVLQTDCNPGRLTLSAMADNGGDFIPFNDLTLRNPYALPVLELAHFSASGPTNTVAVPVYAPDAPSFRLQFLDSLSVTNWTDLARISVTGAVTVALDTNTAPTRFYRALVP